MSLFKNTWFSKLAGKKNNTLEKEAAELAKKDGALTCCSVLLQFDY